MAKILISTPTYAYQSHTRMVGSMVVEITRLRSQGHDVMWNYLTSSALAWARNMSVNMAIKDGYDWLFFWDADVAIESDDGFIENMITLAQEKRLGAVGVPYAFKGFPLEWAVRDVDGLRIVSDLNAGHETNPLGEGKVELRLKPTEPFEAQQVGTGTMLIKVDELKKLTPPWFTFIDGYKDGEVTMWPEDYMFCDALRKNGAKIYADPRFKTQHWGQFAFGAGQ